MCPKCKRKLILIPYIPKDCISYIECKCGFSTLPQPNENLKIKYSL